MTFYLAVKVAMNTSSAKFVTINELRVFELKQELEKRGLDKSGIKLALVERLEAVCLFLLQTDGCLMKY